MDVCIPKIHPKLVSRYEGPPYAIQLHKVCPIEKHPHWSLVHGTGPSKLCWEDGVIKAQTNEAAEVVNLAYKGMYGDQAVLKGTYLYDSQADEQCWTLPFAKFVDADNLVGIRRRNQTLECIQRKDGTWSTITTIPNIALGYWECYITKDSIILLVNGEQKLRETHEIAGNGYFGISAHKWASKDTVPLVSNYFGYVVEGDKKVLRVTIEGAEGRVLGTGILVKLNVTVEGGGQVKEV